MHKRWLTLLLTLSLMAACSTARDNGDGPIVPVPPTSGTPFPNTPVATPSGAMVTASPGFSPQPGQTPFPTSFPGSVGPTPGVLTSATPFPPAPSPVTPTVFNPTPFPTSAVVTPFPAPTFPPPGAPF